MARKRSSGTAHTSPEAEATNGKTPAQDQVAADGAADPTMQRAEQLVDRMGEQIGRYATVVGRGLLRLAARAREEAEDIWAEAQSIRRREQPE